VQWLGGQRGRAVDAVERCRQLYQHVLDDSGMSISPPGHCDDARAMGEANPWQVPMGRATTGRPRKAWALSCTTSTKPSAFRKTVAAAARLAFQSTRAVAVLIGQRLIGSKKI